MVLPARAQLTPLVESSKVKTTGSGTACVVTPGTSTCDAGVVAWLFSPLGFTAASPAPVISPVASDPRTHTNQPLSVPVLGCRDFNSDGYCDIYYQWTTNSLLDVGVYQYQLDCTFSRDGVNVGVCNPNTLSLNIYNQAPTGSVSVSGTPGIHNTITLNGSGNDPDGGAVHYYWRIAQPASHAATLATPNNASTTINFVDERDIGNWRIEVDIDDDEGERKTFSTTFNIPNLPPDISITGANAVDALQPIVLSASTTTDPDGGPPLTLRWDILNAPTGASQAPQSNFAGTASGGPSTITIPTTDRDIGTWRFRLTARDNENSEDSAEIEVTVRNLPPKITLSTAANFEIDAGQTITTSNTTPDDPDGGTVTHDWELIQAPVAAGVAPGLGFQTGPTLTVTNAAAGTWIFKLHATDNDNSANSEVTQNVQVLVDGPATASITGPATSNVLSALTIDGSGSLDADSPPASVPNHGHVTSAASVVLSPGIVSYYWTLVDVPMEHFPTYITGPIEYSLDVANGTPVLNLAGAALLPGSWTCQLEVTDAEGNVDSTTYTVLVLEPNTPPIAILSPPRFFLTDALGVTPQPIGVDASASFDLDNLLSSAYAPGLGISEYNWQITVAPPGCSSLPTPPSGSGAAQFQLYAASSAVPLPCHGSYGLLGTVRDDDTPKLSNTAQTALIIGNCGAEICIDYPTNANYQYVEFADQTDVMIYYHLNSAIYANPLFSIGLRVELTLFHESNLTTPAYTGQFDYDVLTQELGGHPAIHWHGYTNTGTRPKPGKYTVRMRATQPLLPAPYSEAVESNAIWLEVVDVAIESTSDRLLSLNRLDSGTDHLRLNYSATAHFTSSVTYDEATLHIRSAADPSTILGSVPIVSTGTFDWTGELSPGVIVDAGNYTAEIEVFKAGHSLGTSPPWAFTAYRMDMQVDGVAADKKQTPGAAVEINSTPKNVTVTLRPSSLTGDVVLRTTGNPGAVEIRDGGSVLATDGGLTQSATSYLSPKTLTVKTLSGTSSPTRFEAVYTPPSAPANKDATDFVNIHGLDFGLKPACAVSSALETPGLFLQRNATPVAAASFEQLKFIMQPLKVVAQPAVGTTSTEVSLEYESGDASIAAVFDGTSHSLVAAPKTWSASDFDATTHRLEVPLFANGAGYGEAVLRLRYKADGTELATKRVKLRVGDHPGYAGLPYLTDPFFSYGRVYSEGATVIAGLDPSRFAERVGLRASIYAVPHKTPAQWAADPSLAGAPVTAATVVPGSILVNFASLGTPAVGAYDIVYDFGACPEDPSAHATDSRLDPGDLIDTISPDQPSFVVLPNLLAAGPLPIASAEYGTGAAPSTTHVPDGYDGLVGAFDFRLRGKLVYPNPLPAGTLPLVAIAHGRHTPLKVDFGAGWVTVDPAVTREENYRGYTYLQEHLARNGYITLSVDLDETIGDSSLGYRDITTGGIRLRANVLLRNIQEVLTNAAIAGGALVGKIDPASVFLVGHSRGAEAVIVATGLLAGTVAKPAGSPTWPAITAKGVISIAPVSFETTPPPAGRPFLLLYGSADGDVNGATSPGVWPFVHYDRAAGPAHMIYALGANHNFFNWSWPNSDSQPGAPDPDVGSNLLTRPQQEDLAKAYALAFLRLYQEGNAAYGAYLTSPPKLLRPAGLPADGAVPLMGAVRLPVGPSRVVVDDYQTNFGAAGLALASSGATVTHTLASLSEETLRDTNLASEAEAYNRFFQDTNGAMVGWGAAAANYEFALPAAMRDVRNGAIALRFALQPPSATTAAPGTDFSVTLVDGGGNSSTVQASFWRAVRGTYPSVVDGNWTTKGVFETFVFPWWAFVANGHTLNLGDIRTVRLGVAAPAGHAAVDDLEIWR